MVPYSLYSALLLTSVPVKGSELHRAQEGKSVCVANGNLSLWVSSSADSQLPYEQEPFGNFLLYNHYRPSNVGELLHEG
jgi:hypothetical protein